MKQFSPENIHFSKKGMEIMESDVILTNTIVNTFKEISKLYLILNQNISQSNIKRILDKEKRLINSFLLENKGQIVGRGGEGNIYKVNYPTQPIIIKHYHNMLSENNSLGEFNKLLSAKSEYFKLPKAYFATYGLVTMEDFSQYQEYFEFLLKYKREEETLNRHLINVINKEKKIEPDCTHILFENKVLNEEYSEELKQKFRSENKSGIFIVEFNKNKKNPFERYKLGCVDI